MPSANNFFQLGELDMTAKALKTRVSPRAVTVDRHGHVRLRLNLNTGRGHLHLNHTHISTGDDICSKGGNIVRSLQKQVTL
jgi:hypothetical protein